MTRLAVLALLALAASCQGIATPDPAVAAGCAGAGGDAPAVLCEDFEDGAFPSRWNIGSNRDRWPPSQFVRCEGGFGFGGGCAAWSHGLVFDQAWGFYGYDARRAFLPLSELYVRWYQYVSDPYAWGTLEDKSVMLHDPLETIVGYVATNRNQLPYEPDSGPGLPFVANYQDLDWPETGGGYTLVNRFQNQGRNIALAPGRWYLFEWYVRLNTPGSSNGVTKLWIDEATRPPAAQTLRLHYTDMRWLTAGDAGKQLGLLRLTVYHQRCDIAPDTCPPRGPEVREQHHRWDDIVVSRTPVGPRAD